MVYGLLVGSIIYPLYGNWVWGGGWLATLGSNFGIGHGHVDFAGSSVVHMTGGVLALVGAMDHRAPHREIQEGRNVRTSFPLTAFQWR